ncbi:MAG TPA: M23 family metallopeptidase [Gemmatimonadales bacterium]|nr:M23 family metallopeptidase [Gemmatimonadales bacterium]
MILRQARAGGMVWAVTLLSACGSGGPTLRFAVSTPREDYEAQLRHVGLHTTALGRDWSAAAARALAAPLAVNVPHREARYLDPTRAAAVGYQVRLERGQRLAVRIELPSADTHNLRLFVDLYFAPDDLSPPHLVASADTGWGELEYVALRPGAYVLRVQPELLRGGRVSVTLSAHASLAFPVVGRDLDAARSGFGAPRDGGRREHHGVDIFAPRGTPVLAAVAGRVTRVGSRGIGGNVVWLRETRWGRRLYYAHLDRFAVEEDTWVQPGDTLGFVGNTGNARTTPPHLHFGIYQRGEGPVNPHFHLYEPTARPPVFVGNPELVGAWARVAASGATLRQRSESRAPVLSRAPAHTPVEVLGGTGRWYLVRSPDGTTGYTDLSGLRPLEAIHEVPLVAAADIRTAPSWWGDTMDHLGEGTVVPVLGWFDDQAMVRHPDGPLGWIPAHALPGGEVAVAPEPAARVSGVGSPNE